VVLAVVRGQAVAVRVGLELVQVCPSRQEILILLPLVLVGHHNQHHHLLEMTVGLPLYLGRLHFQH
jgi:hypothetical protein